MRLRDIFLNPDQRMVVNACETLFDGVCAEEGTVTQVVYGRYPQERVRAWKEIRAEALKHTQLEGGPRVRAIREAMTEAIEHCVTANFYSHLDEVDRDIFARNILSSTMQQQDHFYYCNHAYNLARAHVMSQMFYLGWSEDEQAKENVREVQRVFQDQCKQHCELILKIARANEKGTSLTDAEKESGKTVLMLKDLARRALAGDKLD